MNRLKLWLFALLVVGAAALTLRVVSVQLRDTALRTLDARLGAAASRVAAVERALSSETSAVAVLAARDGRLVDLLEAKELAPEAVRSLRGRRGAPRPAADAAADPEREEDARQEAARAAVADAEQALGFALPPGTQIATGDAEWVARKALDAGDADQPLVKLLEGAVQGNATRGWLRRAEGLWYAAAAPVPTRSALLLLVPIDPAWVSAAARGTAVDVTLGAGEQPVVTALPSADATSLVTAALASAGSPGSAGRLAPIPLRVGGISGSFDLLFAKAPAHRALAVPLAGLEGGFAVVSAPTRPLLAPLVEFQWLAVIGLGVILVLGILFGLLVHPTEVAAAVPGELVAAASRIERGDFAARAPTLAGKVGTVAAALNRAAEAAEASAARAPSLAQELAPPPPAEADPSAFDFPPRARALAASSPEPATEPAPEPLPAAPEPFAAAPYAFSGAPDPFSTAPEPFPAPPPEPPAALELSPLTGMTQRLDRSGLDAFDAPAERAPAPPAPLRNPPPVFATASAPELLQAAALAAPAEGDGDDAHWRDVFEDFVRIRGECGESAQNLSFDRFRQKLESNRSTLIAKYGCRTVRFQVYVKEGKAALKATPVR